MKNKIIFLNQTQASDPRVKSLLSDSLGHEWDQFFEYRKFNPGFGCGLYNRIGVNNLPFKNDLVEVLDIAAPEYNDKFNKDIDSIHDERCLELKKSKFDKPWVVYWSGGIDSTLIICSILKNFSAGELANVSVACNRTSIAEYPRFFFNFIKPNFKILDSSAAIHDPAMIAGQYSIFGEPADLLFSGSVSQSMMLSSPEVLKKNIFNDPDDLIAQMATGVSSKFAHWYYELVIENIRSVPIPITSYHDFYWWTFFNHGWTAAKMRLLLSTAWAHQATARPYLENKIHWFETHDYQHWAMVNNVIGKKYSNNIGAYKQDFKNYIYQFTDDKYYWKFKTKISSGSHLNFLSSPVFCVLDDFKILSLDHDLDQIIALLPEHINRSV